MDYFVFGGVDTRNFDIHIFDLNTDLSPKMLVDEIKIPGRNGSLLMKNNSFENVQHRYMGVVYENAADNLAWFRSEIMKNSGYMRLEDSIHLEEFYEARYVGGLEPVLTPERTMAKFAIEFSRKPQRFLKSGERTYVITGNSTVLENPTPFPARPLVRAYGTGTFSFGGKSVTVSSHSYDYVDVDSEMMDCYCGPYNLNAKVSLNDYEFPELLGGTNTIQKDSTLSRLEIIPRWWAV